LSSLFFIFSSDGISVTAQLKLCGFLQFLQKNNGGNYIVYRYICHLLNNPATEWHSMPLYIYFCHRVAYPWHHCGISMPTYINFCHLLANPFHFLATKLPPFKFICQLGNFACHLCGISMPKRWHINATLLLFLPPIEIGGKIFLCLHRLSQ